MILLSISIMSLVLSLVPAIVFARNVRLFRAPASAKPRAASASILIPARDEAGSIEACVRSALNNIDVVLEVIVLDDGSTDGTADIVRQIAQGDARVRVESAPPLPEGWCGKQHACFRLSKLARFEWLIFIDADVRLAHDAASRAIGFAIEQDTPLVSGFPRQVTGNWMEKLLIPLIHFVLLGFLPIDRMRKSTSRALGAGCGQFFVAKRAIYEQVGGHATIKSSLHDGVKLPRAFRAAGFKTDLFDATDLATCRMYRSAGEVWRGLSKNATEGMASPIAIGPWTILLGLGQVWPAVMLSVAVLDAGLKNRVAIAMLMAAALAMGWIVRLTAAKRFSQNVPGAMLHPLGIAMLLVIQWQALVRGLSSRPSIWKGRAY